MKEQAELKEQPVRKEEPKQPEALFLKESHLKQVQEMTAKREDLVKGLLHKNNLETQLDTLTDDLCKLKEQIKKVTNELNQGEHSLKELLLDVYGPINIVSLETGEYNK